MGNDQVKWEASCWNVKISLYEINVSGSGTERIIQYQQGLLNVWNRFKLFCDMSEKRCDFLSTCFDGLS